MIKWVKMGTTFDSEGRTTIYEAENAPLTIESRLRHVPHANRSGTWDCTTYFVLKDGQELAEKHSLRDAKEYAERLANGEDKSNY